MTAPLDAAPATTCHESPARAVRMWPRPRRPAPMPPAQPHDAASAHVARRDGSRAAIAERRLLAADPSGGEPTVHVERGVAWVTQAGDPRDHIVRAGASVALARHGRVVIQAIAAGGADLRLVDLRTS